jgi:hypothetical protein
MKKPEELLELALNNIRRIKELKGEFLVGKGYEQGPLPIQKCTVLSVYYREDGKNILLYRWRACTNGDNLEETFEEAYSETISTLILNWEEIWNLINTKPQ